MQDPTEFRRRFKEYKNGKSVSEIYDAGLPRYQSGRIARTFSGDKNTVPFDNTRRIKLTNAGLATGAILSENLLDEIAEAAYRQGLPIKTAIGLAVKESTLGNPTDDTSVYKILSPEKAAWFKQQGTGSHINNGHSLNMQDVVNYHREDNYPEDWNMFDRAFRFYADTPYKYNPGQKNHQQLVDKRANEAWASPEIQNWYKNWEAGKIQVNRPEEYKINTSVQNTAAKPFFKNGKLPGYYEGTSGWNKDESTQKAEQWTDDWQFRLTPAAGSKVVQQWNATGNKPEPESAEQYTQRRIKQTEWKKPSGRKMLEMAPAAVDFVPGSGDVKQGLEAVNAAINKDYLTAGILGSLLIAPSAAAKLINRSINKVNDLAPIVNDIAKSPYLPDELDAWTSIMKNRNYQDRKAERIFEQNLPDLISMKDEWVKYGAKGEEPKLWDWDTWHNMNDNQKFSNLFEKRVNSEFNKEYYIIKPWYKHFVEINGGTRPYGYSFRGDVNSPNIEMFSRIPNEIKSENIPIIHDISELDAILGLKSTPVSYKIAKPKLPTERVDWSDYRKQLKERILDDWNSDGPLRSHLQRSEITDPTVLLDYMLSPEQAWKQSLSKPGLDISQAFFNANLKDDVMRDPIFLKGFQESLNKVLKRYGESPMTIDKSNIITTSYVRDQIINHTLRSRRKADKIFTAAFNDVLKRNPDAAKQFYIQMDKTYDNAFANSTRGTMYISPLRKTFGRTVSHELGHLEDLDDFALLYKDKPHPGVIESTQNTITPSSDTPLFEKAFDLSKVSGSTKRYFSGRNNATEMAQRATQIADYLKLKKGEPITPEKLKYAMENYIKDTGMDNNMTEFFSTIKDIKAAAKWMSAFHKAIIPIGVAGTATYKTLKPRKENK